MRGCPSLRKSTLCYRTLVPLDDWRRHVDTVRHDEAEQLCLRNFEYRVCERIQRGDVTEARCSGMSTIVSLSKRERLLFV